MPAETPVVQVADMRVFCTLAGDPSRTGVIAVSPDMSSAQIAALAAEVLDIRSGGCGSSVDVGGRSDAELAEMME